MASPGFGKSANARLPSVSILIVDYDTERYLAKCLNSIFSASYPRGKLQVIVVDNSPNGGAYALVKRRFPHVFAIKPGTNLGFAGGNLLAFAKATGDIIVLLNSDTIVKKDWLLQLVAPLVRDSRIAITGSKAYYPNSRKIQHAGGIINPNGLTDHIGYGLEDKGQFDKEKDVDYVTGSSLAVRRSYIERHGFLSPSYFPAYYEETEMCQGARRNGYRVVVAPQSVLYHFESSSAAPTRTEYLRMFHKNRIKFVWRNYSLPALLVRFIPAEVKWLLRKCPPSQRPTVLRAYVQNALEFADRWRR